jgi:hypothetical protein
MGVAGIPARAVVGGGANDAKARPGVREHAERIEIRDFFGRLFAAHFLVLKGVAAPAGLFAFFSLYLPLFSHISVVFKHLAEAARY